jgi:hypothetical protein
MSKPEEGDATVGWHIMPFVSVKANFWAPNFYAGFRFESDGEKNAAGNTTINWSVPLGIYFEW